ncbi:hypothetical protein Lesp02_13740 [Lentzea sp. NBRC 105346]|nr:hypothetical protein Lesp02_13740 [Lentzea sp. NBRC 105346]
MTPWRPLRYSAARRLLQPWASIRPRPSIRRYGFDGGTSGSNLDGAVKVSIGWPSRVPRWSSVSYRPSPSLARPVASTSLRSRSAPGSRYISCSQTSENCRLVIRYARM